MSRSGNETFYQRYGKRVIDLCLSLVLLILFWWVLAIVAILVRVKLGGPVLFKQPRPGKDEKIFKLYKFRTMTDERDEKGNLLPDEVRLTRFGKALRATSLDELQRCSTSCEARWLLSGRVRSWCAIWCS